jgi:hypothetical protein
MILATKRDEVPVENRSQITPLQTENGLEDRELHNSQELSPPHLLPEEASKTKDASDTTE